MDSESHTTGHNESENHLVHYEKTERRPKPYPVLKAREWIQRHDLTLADVRHIIRTGHPSPGYNGATVYQGTPRNCRRSYAVTVSKDEKAVLSVSQAGTEHIEALPAPKVVPRMSGTKRDTRIKLPHDHKSFLKLLRSHRFTVTQTRKHMKITHPEHPGLSTTIPVTPGDSRAWIKNQTSDIKKRFGIDLRQPPTTK